MVVSQLPDCPGYDTGPEQQSCYRTDIFSLQENIEQDVLKGAKVLDYWIWSTLQASTHKDCEKTFNKVLKPPQAAQWNPPITWLHGKENISARLFHQVSLIQNSWAMSLASCWEIGWNRGKLQSMKLITVRKQKTFQNCSLSSAFSRKYPSLQVNSCCTLPCGTKTQLLSKCNLAAESTEAPTSLHILRQSNHLCFTRRLLSWFWHLHGVMVTEILHWAIQAACERSVWIFSMNGSEADILKSYTQQ